MPHEPSLSMAHIDSIDRSALGNQACARVSLFLHLACIVPDHLQWHFIPPNFHTPPSSCTPPTPPSHPSQCVSVSPASYTPPACIVPGQLLGILPSWLSTEMSIPFTHGTVYVVSVRYANNIAFLEKGRQLPSLMLPAKHYNIISISNSAKNCVVFALLVLSDVPC